MTTRGGPSTSPASRTIRVQAEPANLARIRRFVEEQAAAVGADPAVVPDMVQAVDESVTNVIAHGYRRGAGIVEVELHLTQGALAVRIRDRAPRFDPTHVPPPDLNASLEQRPLGGMGVLLVRELTDEVRYSSPEGWTNELTLFKRIPSTGDKGR